MSALFSYARVLPRATGPLSRARADFHGVSGKLTHTAAPGSPRPTGTPTTSLLRGHINAARRAEKFSTTTAKTLEKQSQVNGSSSRERRGWLLGKVALGTAVGVSTVALVQSLHTGTVAAMARKVDPNSTEVDWKETKGETASKLTEI